MASISPRMLAAIAGGAVLVASALLAARSALARPRGVEPADRLEIRYPRQAPRAQIAAGSIRRDAATLAAIRALGQQSLPSRARESWRLVVRKSRYRLDLFDGERLLKVYPIALGHAPAGDKERQGDERTPEGDFRLIPHHPSPNFGSCFYVCYPDPPAAQRGLYSGLINRGSWRDILLSHADGRRPPYWTDLGGLILIHGTKDRSRSGLTRANWTRGCIAMENGDLLELLDTFSPDDRPTVSIRP